MQPEGRATRCLTSRSRQRLRSLSSSAARSWPRSTLTLTCTLNLTLANLNHSLPQPRVPTATSPRGLMASTTSALAASTCARSGRNTSPSCPSTTQSTRPRLAARRLPPPTSSLCSPARASSRRRPDGGPAAAHAQAQQQLEVHLPAPDPGQDHRALQPEVQAIRAASFACGPAPRGPGTRRGFQNGHFLVLP